MNLCYSWISWSLICLSFIIWSLILWSSRIWSWTIWSWSNENEQFDHYIIIILSWIVWSLVIQSFIMWSVTFDHESIDHCCHHLIMNHLIMNLCSKPHDQSHVGSSSTAKHWSYHPKNQQPTTYIYILFSSTTNHPLIFSRVTMVRKKVENVIWIETSLSHQKFGFPGCSRNPISGVLYFYTDPAHGSSQSRMDRLSVSIDHRKKKILSSWIDHQFATFLNKGQQRVTNNKPPIVHRVLGIDH